jgi:hypothetical protein
MPHYLYSCFRNNYIYDKVINVCPKTGHDQQDVTTLSLLYIDRTGLCCCHYLYVYL